jgi:recombination protein RecT
MSESAKTALAEIANAPLRRVPSVKELLINNNARVQLQKVAANHMNAERMMRVVANAIRTTPKLQQCEPISFLGALMQCAALGLEPNTVLGHAYLIPFDRKKKVKDEKTGRENWVKVTEAQVVIGYKGLIDLARRSGHITSIHANIHYSDDELWEYEEGTEATLRHRPGPQDGDKLHAYAIAKFKDGGHAYVVMPWKAVMKIRDGSQNWKAAVEAGKTKDAPWSAHEDAMAKKTAIRALAKYLPLSVEFADAIAIDERAADYRAFAMDPTVGVTIEGDVETVETYDSDTGEITSTRQIDQERGDSGGGDVVDTAAEAATKSDDTGQTKSEPKNSASTRFEGTIKMLMRELAAEGEDVLYAVYGESIEQIQREDPEAFKHLEAAIAAWRTENT